MSLMKRRKAASKAGEIIAMFGFKSGHEIEIEDLASHFGAIVTSGSLTGAVARMSRIGDTTVIRVVENADPGRRRFSLAHELGHLVMHDGCMKTCSQADLESWRSIDEQESEANAFAAELLMPSTIARKACEVSPVSLKLIRSIASDFRTSITATAIRFVELTSEPCAVVYSGDGVIEWAIRNRHFGGVYLDKRAKLDRRTVAFRLSSSSLFEEEGHVPADAWIGSESLVMSGSEWLHESAIRGPNGRILSILWRDSMRDDEDDDGESDDDARPPAWSSSRFRR